jgi:hypothetical protein
MAGFLSYDTEPARDALSRVLLRQSRRAWQFDLRAPLVMLGAEVLDECAVTHYAGPDAGGAGWGSRIFERRHCEATASRFNPGSRDFRLGLRDVRGSLGRAGLWTPGRARYQTRERAGQALVASGNWCFFRPSTGWTDFGPEQLVTAVEGHLPRVGPGGMLLERFAGCVLSDSAVARTGTDWASTGTGVNGSAIATTTAYLVWDKAISPNACLLTAGNPHAADLYVSQAAALGVFNTYKYTLSITHLDLDNTQLGWQLLLGGNYWNDTTKAFQVGAVWNLFPAAPATITRHSAVITANATATPTVRIGIPTGGTASRRHVVFDAILEAGRGVASHPWPSSRIASPAGSPGTHASRSGEFFCVESADGTSGWRTVTNQGTLLARITPLWTSGADVSGMTFYLLRAYYTANSEISVFYDGTNGQWTFRRRTGGVNYDCNLVSGVTPVEISIAARWGSSGELDDIYGAPTGANQWGDLIVAGTRVGLEAPDVVGPQSGIVWIGSSGADDTQIDAWTQVQIVPYVLSESEIAKWI